MLYRLKQLFRRRDPRHVRHLQVLLTVISETAEKALYDMCREWDVNVHCTRLNLDFVISGEATSVLAVIARLGTANVYLVVRAR